MRVSITYLYTIFKYGYPPKIEDDFRSLEEINKMGFHYLEMEGLGPKHTEQVWKHKEDLKQCLDDNDIHVHNFCGVDPALTSFDDKVRKQAYEKFKRTAELAAFFESETLHLASYSPPVEYPNGSPYALDGDYEFGDIFQIKVPNGFSWQKVWDVLVESCQFTSGVAKEHGKTIIMEPRVGEVICSPDSLLRLIQDVGCNNFKANFDTGHFSAQRENVSLALMKLEGQYANIHIADNDPQSIDHLPMGQGVIDWQEFFRVLKMQNYDGYLGLDLGGKETIVDDLLSSLNFIQSVAKEQGITIEY